ncbi:MAG TPA: S41 family peptidase [Saprospiraceae bacterium]|nr:S41 family peptidase [Saprospiraceae bacterium]HND88514.1 S41 family peptidase [Saprospiraceae bacterium]
MRLPTLLALAFCLVVAASSAQSIRADEMRHDLDFLQHALYECHPGAFRFSPKASLDSLFDSLRGQIPPDSISLRAAQRMVRQAVAAVRDGHTAVLTPYYDNNTRILPLLAVWAQDSLYIEHNYSADTTLLRGSALLSANGMRIDELIRQSRMLNPGDGFSPTFGHEVVAATFARLPYLLQGDTSRYDLHVISPRGITSQHSIPAITRKELQTLQQTRLREARRQSSAPRQAPVMFTRSMALRRDTAMPGLLILKLNSFPRKHYRRFYREVFTWLDQHPPQALVIDVRNNTGGNIRNMDRLLSYIVPERFSYDYLRHRHAPTTRYFKGWQKLTLFSIWMRYNLWPGFRYRREGEQRVQHWQVKPRKRHRYTGQTFVLTNGWSFSSASMCASFLKNRAGATVVGRETGGGEWGNCGGGYPKLALPHSKIKVRFPLFLLRYDIGKSETSRGVMPDVATPYSVGDILSGRDLGMEAVRRMVREKPKEKPTHE